ncbi:hypothetical protein LZ32DRAFT_39082 [Colletotrichum eremochloae]|nr:hypothetical protein LZ32DRAFT_39082 [Colletotrichum eremochloae]
MGFLLWADVVALSVDVGCQPRFIAVADCLRCIVVRRATGIVAVADCVSTAAKCALGESKKHQRNGCSGSWALHFDFGTVKMRVGKERMRANVGWLRSGIAST